MPFYEALAIAMDDRNLSAADLSVKTGMYPSYFSKLKNGHTKDVTWEKARLIVSSLGMSLDEFSQLQNGGRSDE